MFSLFPVFDKGRFYLRLFSSCNLMKSNKETDKNVASILSVYIPYLFFSLFCPFIRCFEKLFARWASIRRTNK